MIDVSNLNLSSKVFRAGDFTTHLDLAVRALPKTHLSTEQRVNYQWALDVYEKAICELDALDVDRAHFSSGISAAAIIMITLHPETMRIWKDLAKRVVHFDHGGFNAAGMLYYLVERHKNDVRLTRRSDYQLYLFQSALAVSSAWLRSDRKNQRFRDVPEVPLAPDLLEQVKAQVGEYNKPDGFRSFRLLKDRWHVLKAPKVSHTIDADLIRALAISGAADLEPAAEESRVFGALERVLDIDPDPELAHPALLGAAAVTLACCPESESVWNEVFDRTGSWRPTVHGRVEANSAGMILRSLMFANRESDSKDGAMRLFERILGVIRLWRKHGDVWRRSAPRTPKESRLLSSWQSIQADLGPEIAFSTPYEGLSEQEPDDAPGYAGSGSRKASPGATKKRKWTGREGEEWLMENYKDVFSEFPEIELYDHRLGNEGYDFLAETPEPIYIEVKTWRGDDPDGFCMGNRQREKALIEGGRYFLVIIVDIDSDNPRAHKIKNPVVQLDLVRKEVQVTQVTWHPKKSQLQRVLGLR